MMALIWPHPFQDFFGLLYSGHPSGCCVLSVFWSAVLPAGDCWCWAPCICLVSLQLLFFGEMSLQILCPLLNWVPCLFYCWALWVPHSTWIKVPHWVIWAVHDFLPWCGLSLHHLDVILCGTSLNSEKVQSAYSFVTRALGVIAKKPLPNPSPWRSVLFPCEGLQWSPDTHTSTIVYLELVFVDGMRKGPSSILLQTPS